MLADFVDGVFSSQEISNISGIIELQSKVPLLLYTLALGTSLIILGIKERNRSKFKVN